MALIFTMTENTSEGESATEDDLPQYIKDTQKVIKEPLEVNVMVFLQMVSYIKLQD